MNSKASGILALYAKDTDFTEISCPGKDHLLNLLVAYLSDEVKISPTVLDLLTAEVRNHWIDEFSRLRKTETGIIPPNNLDFIVQYLTDLVLSHRNDTNS